VLVRSVAWITLGWLGTAFWTAVGSRVSLGHVIPDAALITVAFIAVRREPIPVVGSALLLGYLVGRQALAPTGAHEVALVACAIGCYMASGQIAGSGTLFFALLAGAATMAYHAVLFFLLASGRGAAGFSGWATAALVPSGLATAVVALLAYRPMLWLDGKLATERREDLGWS
jgi:hypothetical protein